MSSSSRVRSCCSRSFNRSIERVLLTLWLVTAGASLAHGSPLVEQHPQRELILQSLQRCMDEHEHGSEIHFFFLRRADGDWVYWREGRLLWKTTFDPFEEDAGPRQLRARAVWNLRLCTPRKPIDLDRSEVRAPSTAGRADHRRLNEDVPRIIADCVSNGEMVTVYRRNRDGPPVAKPPKLSPPASPRNAS